MPSVGEVADGVEERRRERCQNPLGVKSGGKTKRVWRV
jgi:hypothetical protein